MKQLFILIATLCVVTACHNHGGPPEVAGPEPAPHDGVFVADGDTLVFNGDGKTVSWSFTDSVGDLAPKGEGTYAFRFHYGLYRYDAAEDLFIYDGENSKTFMLVPRATTESEIRLSGKKPFKKISQP